MTGERSNEDDGRCEGCGAFFACTCPSTGAEWLAALDRVRVERDALAAEVERLREASECNHIAKVEQFHRAESAEARAAALQTAIEAAPTLARMQRTQPWTAPYSDDFARSKVDEPHRSLMHDLLHVTKAVGILSSIAEWADHGSVRTERVDQAEYEGRIADLVMCALHMANNPPGGYAAFVLERAVIERVQRVNRVEWFAAAAVGAVPETPEKPRKEQN